MYMSYCRHEGTYRELAACLADAEEHVNGEAEYDVSDSEIRYFRRMVEDFTEWLNNMELLDEYGDLDAGRLDEICEAMEKSYRQERDYE